MLAANRMWGSCALCCAALGLSVFALGPRAMAQAAPAEGILIEAENFTRKTPNNSTFATPSKDSACSGGSSLSKFYTEGRCFYDFTIATEGVYYGWLRYGLKQGAKTLLVAIDPKSDSDFRKANLPETGGYIGPGVWKWAPIFEQRLAPGKHTLVMQAVSMRPDCIYISMSKEEPKMAIADAAPVTPLTPAMQQLLAKPIEPIRPDWLDGASDYRLPLWYDQWRVCAHTRLGPPTHDKPIFLAAEKEFRDLGFNVYSRHIKSGDEGAWWPTKVGGAVVEWAKDRNVAKEIIDNAHKNGLRLIAYNRHMEDAAMVAQHPDWVCVDAAGKHLHTNRGDNLCFNSPYAEYFNQRQLELVAMGVDGFFYDEVHMPKSGCWCKFCREKFKAETGLDHPAGANPNDPIWRKLIDFNNATIERTFLKWRAALHARNPEVVMLVGSNTYPGMIDRHMTHRLFRIADSMKTEFSLPGRPSSNRVFENDKSLKPPDPDARLALGYTLSRDAADGRPAHIWAHGLLNEASAVFATAGMIAHGCIANLDNKEPQIPNPELFKKAVELGNTVSPAFATARPLRWALIHYSESARDQCLPDEAAAWKQVLYPVLGAYTAMLRARLPVGVITDSQLEEGVPASCRLLFVPAPANLSEPMRAAIAKFRLAGGTVVEQRADWLWHDPNGGQERAMAAFMKEIATVATVAPAQALGGPAKMHLDAFITPDKKRLTVALCNDFSWVHTGKGEGDMTEDERTLMTAAPDACDGVRVVLNGTALGLGAPKKITNAVDGKPLAFKQSAGASDALEVTVPRFDAMAVVVAEY